MEIKRKNITIISLTLVLSLFLSCFAATDTYAASGSQKQKVSSVKKSIKTYNTKTAKLAKKTPGAVKYAKKTLSYYKKSKKTKSIKKLKTLRTKAKKAYKNARVLDYRRQISEVYKDVLAVAKQAPSIKQYETDALSLFNKSKKCKSISTLKSYLTKIKTINKNAKTAKSKLTWHDAEYRQEWVESHYQTIIDSPAQYEYMIVSYFVWIALDKGFKTGFTYDWDLDKCIENGAVFPIFRDKDHMKEWGLIAYVDEDDNIQRVIESSELSDYVKYLMSIGIETQNRETGEWFLMKEEVSHEKWIEGYYKKILVKEAGWY